MFRPQDMPQKVSKALALPAPVGGLNDIDPLAQMDPAYMLDCMNFYPDNGNLKVRHGYQEWCTGLINPVKTIMTFALQDGTFKKFCGTDGGIYGIDASMDNPPKVSACTNGQWEYTNFATAAGQYLVMCNGVDAAKLYDNTTWIDFKQVTTPAAPGEVDQDPKTFTFVLAHMHRLWFATKNSMTVYYLPTDSVGGKCQPLFLGSIFKKGGYIVGMARWSSDSGDGIDDRIVFFTSSGELASYAGTDPSDVSTWSLDAVFFLGSPLSRRSFADYGGDVILLTQRGILPISSLITSKIVQTIFSGALSNKISRTVMALTSSKTGPFPFPPEIMVNPDVGWVIFNINKPSTVRDPTHGPNQFAMNVLTGAWGRFDYPIRTMRMTDVGQLMGTDDGRVLMMTIDQFVDNVPLNGVGGNPILAYAMSAYTYLDDPTFNKHAKFIRPVFQTEVKPSFIIRVLPDFRLDLWDRTPTPNAAVGNAVWDVSKWDMANWAGNENVYRPWCSANVLGYAFAWQLKVSTSSALALSAMEWVWENGDYV